jgi:tripartite-type tricarboxylate transporter receptor subunit TctC
MGLQPLIDIVLLRGLHPRGDIVTRLQNYFFIAIGLAVICHKPACAQSYPERPVTLVVPSPHGTGVDAIGSIVAQQMSSELKQPVIIDNRPGAGGALGAAFVAQAVPDGYTLLLGTSTMLGILPALNQNIAYNPQTSFKPISGLTESPASFVVNPSITVNSCPDFVNNARANPGKYHYASSGVGSLPFLNGEVFKMRAGIDIIHVPFRSDLEADTEVVAGHADMIFQSLSLVFPLIQGSRLNALGIASLKRNSLLPDVPTMTECGYPGFVSSNWTAILAPAGTPDRTVGILNDAANVALNAPQTREALAKLTLDPIGGEPKQLAGRIATESEHWKKVVRDVQVRFY